MEITARFSLIFLLLASTVSAPARIYKWVDDQGQVVYSQTPRPEAQEVKLPKSKKAVTPTTQVKPANVIPVKPAASRNGSGQAGRYCEQAQRNLRLLRNAGPDTVFVTRDKKLVKYNEEERRKRMKIAEKAVGVYCRDRDGGARLSVADSEIASR